MKNRAIGMTLAVALTAVFGPATACDITVGAEYGTYCSGTWATGGWAFNSDTNGADTCASIVSTGGTVQRKGLYKNNDWNRVVARCYPPNFGWVVIFEGVGNGPLTAAYNAAKTPDKPGCTFTVSPRAMAIFDAPFAANAKNGAGSYVHATGFDFALPPYNTLNVADFGQTGSSSSAIVDWMGRDESQKNPQGDYVYANDHNGHDWAMDRGTSVSAAAGGTVVMARQYDCSSPTVPCGCGAPVSAQCPKGGLTGFDTPLQNEVAIEHKICGGSGFYEKFVTYYAHLKSYSVAVGQTVQKGHQIGLSGNTGASTAPHLHFGVIRLTNTANQLESTVTWLPPPKHSDGGDKAIEPYGWAAPKGFDPWAWRAFPRGALAPNLWNANQAPSTGQW